MWGLLSKEWEAISSMITARESKHADSQNLGLLPSTAQPANPTHCLISPYQEKRNHGGEEEEVEAPNIGAKV